MSNNSFTTCESESSHDAYFKAYAAYKAAVAKYDSTYDEIEAIRFSPDVTGEMLAKKYDSLSDCLQAVTDTHLEVVRVVSVLSKAWLKS